MLAVAEDDAAIGGDQAPPQGQTVPWSNECEQALLGSVLHDNGAYALVSDLVGDASFFSYAHRLIFQTMGALLTQGAKIDTNVLVATLRAREPDDGQWGGVGYVQSLELCVPSASQARKYAEIVAEHAGARALIAGLKDATEIAWDGSTPLVDRLERITSVLKTVESQRTGMARRGVPLLGLSQLRDSAQSVRWLVKHVMPMDSIGIMFGGSGTFKSFIALDAALHIAHGLPWMGRRTQQGPVLYIAAEGGAGLWRRIDAWHRARNLRWHDVPFYVVPVAVDLLQDAWRVVDAAQMLGVAPAMVVIDTLSQTFAGEENNAPEVSAYLRELGTRFRALWQCAVTVIHHSGHQATERPRGSSAIRANVDFMFGVHRDANEMLATLSCVKQKDGDCFDDQSFSMTIQNLGWDDDGDVVNSLVAARLEGTQAVLDAMRGEAARTGRKGRNGMLLDLLGSKDGCPEAELRKAFNDACDAETPEATRQAYKRCMDWAKKAGIVMVDNGRIRVLRHIGD